MKNQLNIDWTHFLNNYWQKQPVILRGAFPNFCDPITPEELAGLALEEEIESRLVSNLDKDWQAKYGPFTEQDFVKLGETNWSLLVQAVDHWHDKAAALVEPFRCFPQWLFDDLMISYAVPNGGVGPHIDQYDVFIIQGMGKRRWRVGDINPNYKQFCAHPALLHVEDFRPILDEEIIAGDILYIPSGFPHDGICLETSLSYSIGFRAPTAQGLVTSFADYLLEHDLGKVHYSEPNLTLPKDPLTVSPNEIEKLKSMMTALINQPDYFNHWFGEYISQSMHSLNLESVEPPYHVDEVIAAFKQGSQCYLVNSIRLINLGQTYYIHGETLDLPLAMIQKISHLHCFDQTVIAEFIDDKRIMNQFTHWVNRGYWYFAD